jgi:hypothetical protein
MLFRVRNTLRTGHWSQHLWVVVTSRNWLDFLNLARITGGTQETPGNMRILIAEDDTALAGFVRKGLEAEH